MYFISSTIKRMNKNIWIRAWCYAMVFVTSSVDFRVRSDCNCNHWMRSLHWHGSDCICSRTSGIHSTTVVVFAWERAEPRALALYYVFASGKNGPLKFIPSPPPPPPATIHPQSSAAAISTQCSTAHLHLYLSLNRGGRWAPQMIFCFFSLFSTVPWDLANPKLQYSTIQYNTIQYNTVLLPNVKQVLHVRTRITNCRTQWMPL